MLITEPVPYAPSASGEVTLSTAGATPSTAMPDALSDRGEPGACSARRAAMPVSSTIAAPAAVSAVRAPLPA